VQPAVQPYARGGTATDGERRERVVRSPLGGRLV